MKRRRDIKRMFIADRSEHDRLAHRLDHLVASLDDIEKQKLDVEAHNTRLEDIEKSLQQLLQHLVPSKRRGLAGWRADLGAAILCVAVLGTIMWIIDVELLHSQNQNADSINAVGWQGQVIGPPDEDSNPTLDLCLNNQGYPDVINARLTFTPSRKQRTWIHLPGPAGTVGLWQTPRFLDCVPGGAGGEADVQLTNAVVTANRSFAHAKYPEEWWVVTPSASGKPVAVVFSWRPVLNESYTQRSLTINLFPPRLGGSAPEGDTLNLQRALFVPGYPMEDKYRNPRVVYFHPPPDAQMLQQPTSTQSHQVVEGSIYASQPQAGDETVKFTWLDRDASDRRDILLVSSGAALGAVGGATANLLDATPRPRVLVALLALAGVLAAVIIFASDQVRI